MPVIRDLVEEAQSAIGIKEARRALLETRNEVRGRVKRLRAFSPLMTERWAGEHCRKTRQQCKLPHAFSGISRFLAGRL